MNNSRKFLSHLIFIVCKLIRLQYIQNYNEFLSSDMRSAFCTHTYKIERSGNQFSKRLNSVTRINCLPICDDGSSKAILCALNLFLMNHPECKQEISIAFMCLPHSLLCSCFERCLLIVTCPIWRISCSTVQKNKNKTEQKSHLW